MTVHSIISRLFAAATLLIVAIGCNTNACTENQSSLPLAGFYGSDGAGIGVDSLCIRGVGAPADSALYSGSSVLTQVYLPLRSTMKTTSFCFQYLRKALNYPQLYDTITLDYTSEPYFTSEECGMSYIYTVTNLTYTTHLIDSVKLLDPVITPVDIEQLHIYFRTATDGDGQEEQENNQESTKSSSAHEIR